MRSKNLTTPGLALSFFRVSLTTFVSIKYTWHFPAGLHALEIGIRADVGHRRQNLGKALLSGADKRRGKDFPVLGLSTPPMRHRALLEGPHNLFIDAANQQIRHLSISTLIPMISSFQWNSKPCCQLLEFKGNFMLEAALSSRPTACCCWTTPANVVQVDNNSCALDRGGMVIEK